MKMKMQYIVLRILEALIIMPNHIHGIAFIVWADPCVCPNKDEYADSSIRAHPQGEHIGSPVKKQKTVGEHTGSPLQGDVSLSRMMQWLRTMSTNEYLRNVKQKGWQPFNQKLWQRKFYDRMIRNENELQNIRETIINNPMKWELDKGNPANWKRDGGIHD